MGQVFTRWLHSAYIFTLYRYLDLRRFANKERCSPRVMSEQYEGPVHGTPGDAEDIIPHAIRRNRHANSLLPVVRLAPELLSKVFVHFADLERATGSDPCPGQSPSSDYPLRPYDWIRIAHVCYQWRAVALASPTLWATIIAGDRTRVVDELLDRAQGASLTVRLCKEAPYRTVSFVFERFSQIRELEIHTPNANVIPRVLSVRNAPRLRVLTLTAPHPVYMVDVPEVFEQCEMPGLAELKVIGAPLRWRSPLLTTSLTRLVLIGQDGGSKNPYDSSTFAHTLTCLARLLSLEHLECRNVLPEAVGDRLPLPGQIARLTSLKTLCLEDDIQSCIVFLERVALPAGVAIALQVIARPREVTLVAAALSSAWTAGAGAGDEHPLLTAWLAAEPGRPGAVQLKCWTTEHEITGEECSADTLPDAVLDVRILPSEDLQYRGLDVDEFEAISRTLMCVLEDFSHALPFGTLRTLCIPSALSREDFTEDTWERCSQRMGQPRSRTAEILLPPIPSSCVRDDLTGYGWERCFKRMAGLRSLSVGRWAAGLLSTILAKRVPIANADRVRRGGKMRQPTEFLLPILQVLRLEGVSMGPDNKTGKQAGKPSATLFKRYYHALDKRRKSKKKLGTVILRQCYNITAQDVTTLEHIVDALEWDGVVPTASH